MCPVLWAASPGSPAQDRSRAGWAGVWARQPALRVISGEAQACPPGALGQGEPEANSNHPEGQALCWGQLMLWGPGEQQTPFLLPAVGPS